LIDQHPDQPKDQPSLQQMYLEQQQQQQQPPKCEVMIMPKDDYLHFPSNSSINMWAREIKRGRWFRKRKTLQYPTLVHIKNSGKVANVSETVENIYLQDLLQGDSTALGIGQKMHFHPDTN
jgi:hypothetical protein